jgi:ketosteroid isomerase-like protein
MRKQLFIVTALALSSSFVTTIAQNTNTRPTTNTNAPAATQTPDNSNQGTPTGTRSRRNATNAQRGQTAMIPAEREVRSALDALIEGIERADVTAVMNAYWNSPSLTLFNNNGTVTRSWEQVRANRTSSYPMLKDVSLNVRDVRVSTLGTDAALVTCLWTQSQTFRGALETATGRLSLVFRKLAGGWKIVHTHTSPDAPDPSRVLPSERTPPATTATPAPAATPVTTPAPPRRP